ncbi:MAG: DeoR/GlpR family DNA-binding transcription regulator [Collinsella sp.]
MAQATNRAFADERRTAIMEMLEHNASVQVAEIAQTFGVSSVTARADLDALAEAGKLRRTHGGAVSLHKRLTVSTQDRRINVNVAAKQAIAQSAIELVNDGDTLLVDSGTTALEFVRLLDQRDGITVITADITIADYIDESMPSVDVVMLGGALRKGHRYLYGPLTCRRSKWSRRPGRHVPWRFCSRLRLYDRLSADGRDQSGYGQCHRQSVALMDASKVTDAACTALPSLPTSTHRDGP